MTVGSAVSYFDQTLVLKALLVTAFIFVGLSLFTFQSRYDFSGLAPFLFTGLMGMLGMGLVGLFVGWGKVRWSLRTKESGRTWLMSESVVRQDYRTGLLWFWCSAFQRIHSV